MSTPQEPFVTLKVKGSDTKKKFVISHALRILALKNCAWELADESYTYKDGDIVKTPKK